MSNIRQEVFNFTANGQTSGALRVNANQRLVFGARGGGNATIILQSLADDGATWVQTRFPNSATAIDYPTTTIGEMTLEVAPGRYRMSTTTFVSAKTGYLRVDD